MSARSGHPRLLARIAASLGELLAEYSQAYHGEMLGVAATTIGRRGDELSQWPASDLLILAAAHPVLAEAIVTYCKGESKQGEAVSLVGDLHQLLGQCGRLLTEASEILRDGKVTPDEAKRLRGIIRVIRDMLTCVESDLEAVP